MKKKDKQKPNGENANKFSEKEFAKRVVALGGNLKRFWKEPPKGRFLNLREILSLGVSSFGVSMIYNALSIYLTITKIPVIYDMGTSGTLHATLMYLLSSVLALILTPFYGRMIQRTNTKFGRYKPYIMFLAPIVSALGIMALWSPQSLDVTSRTIYMYMTCTPALLLWNLWYNSFNMFPGVFSPNQQERADIWSPIGLVMGFAPTVMNALNGVIARYVGDIWAGRIYAICCGVLGTMLVIALIGVKERVFITEEENKKEKITTWQGLKMIVKNKPLMIFTIALCLGCLRNTIDLSWEFVARVKYAANMADAAAIIGGLSLFVGFAATPNMILLPWLTRKFNNRTILIFWQVCNLSANLICALIGLQNFPQGSWSPYVITAIRFLSLFNCLGSLQPLMLSEMGDYQQSICGYRLEGFIQAFAYSLTSVVAQAAALIPAVIQKAMGFNPANYIVSQVYENNFVTPELVKLAENYGNVALWISVGSSALMLICLLFYNLDKKKHAEIVQKLKESAVNADEIESEQGKLNMLENVIGSNPNEGASEDANFDEINSNIDVTSENNEVVDNTNETVEESEINEIPNADTENSEEIIENENNQN